jgi:ADP-heptose:LPS heptosyltransferase
MTTFSITGPVRRIVIVRIGKIGDLIVSSFVMRKVRQVFPDARIVLVTLPRTRELLRYDRTVDRVIYFRGGVDLLSLVLRINAFRPDMMMDLNDRPSTTSTLISRLCPARIRAGFSFPGKRLSHPVVCPPLDRTHITERLRLIPEALGLSFSPEEVRPGLDLGPYEAEEIRRSIEPLREGHRRFVAVNLSAGAPSRYWPRDRWKALLLHVSSHGVRPVFILLTAPGEERLGEELMKTLPSLQFYLPAGRGFHHFAACIAQSDLLISPDTSAVHIASAFEVPVLGLYPSAEWNFRSWQPIGTRFEIARPPDGDVGDLSTREVIRAYDTLTRIPC